MSIEPEIGGLHKETSLFQVGESKVPSSVSLVAPDIDLETINATIFIGSLKSLQKRGK